MQSLSDNGQRAYGKKTMICFTSLFLLYDILQWTQKEICKTWGSLFIIGQNLKENIIYGVPTLVKQITYQTPTIVKQINYQTPMIVKPINYQIPTIC